MKEKIISSIFERRGGGGGGGGGGVQRGSMQWLWPSLKITVGEGDLHIYSAIIRTTADIYIKSTITSRVEKRDLEFFRIAKL